MRTASVRFYFDADTLGLAKLLASIRNDVTFPGDPGAVLHGRHRPPCPISDVSTSDLEWIPLVARLGWTIITRDAKIARRPAERAAVLDAGARLVVISSSEALTKFGMLEVVMCQWRHVERVAGESGPFIETITRTSSRRIAP